MIKILIVDDHAVLRTGLRLLFNSQPDMQVIGEACDGQSAVEAVQTLRPDVVTLDLTMPGIGGLSVLQQIRAACSSTQVLVLTMHDDTAYIKAVLAAGGAGYVTKTADESEVLSAVRAASQGRTYFGLSVNDILVQTLLGDDRTTVPATAQTALSDREREVLGLVAQGYTNVEIADRLFLSVKTIETYRARLMTKLRCESRAHLVQHAIQLGLLGPTANPDSTRNT